MIEEMLSQHAVMSPFHEFILLHGTLMEGIEPSLPQRTKKECFKNSTDFVAENMRRRPANQPRYYEGFVLKHDLPILIHHAWNMDAYGRVLDLTLRGCEGAEYYGIHVDNKTLIDRTLDQGYYGIFSNGMTYEFEFIKERWGYDMLAFKPPECFSI
jgi:hypothetical protein